MTAEERRIRRRERITEDILSAAEKVIERQGLLNAGMKQIAEEAGIAKGTLYLYFDSKSDLLTALVTQTHDYLIGIIKETMADSSSPPEQLEAIIHRFNIYYKEKHGFHRVMFMSFIRGHQEIEEISEVILSGINERLSLLSEVFQRGVKEGYFREVSPDFAMSVLSAMFHHMMMSQIIKPDTRHPEDFCEQVLGMFFNGVKRSV